VLERISFGRSVDSLDVPGEIRLAITTALRRIEAFQDRWDRPQIEQFVAADYVLVFQTLNWIQQTQPLISNRFLEWGCGFSVVACMAAKLGWDAIGIEAEQDLLTGGQATARDWFDDPSQGPELLQGNFLPAGSETFADDPTLPSLGHPVADVYESLGLDVDDFALVYSYPWPGENQFHEDVFDHHAARGAIHLQFAGPHDMRIWRKIS